MDPLGDWIEWKLFCEVPRYNGAGTRAIQIVASATSRRTEKHGFGSGDLSAKRSLIVITFILLCFEFDILSVAQLGDPILGSGNILPTIESEVNSPFR